MSQFISIGSDSLRAKISPVGAALARLYVPNQDTSLVLGLETPEHYRDAPHAIGVIVGPIAGRISGAQVVINNITYDMETNAGPDCLHSGAQGVQNNVWTVKDQSDAHVTLTTQLPDGAAGLPGNRSINAIYSVQGTTLRLEITAHSDADTALNLASHAYWNLDGTADLSNHLLQLPTHKVCETNANMLPTGRVIESTKDAFDFRAPRCPIDGPALDGCFALSHTRSHDLRPALELSSGLSGLGLSVATTEPGLVLYSGEHLPTLAAPTGCPPIAPFSGLAIEAMGWPDAPSHASFPSITLEMGKIYRQITEYSIELP